MASAENGTTEVMENVKQQTDKHKTGNFFIFF